MILSRTALLRPQRPRASPAPALAGREAPSLLDASQHDGALHCFRAAGINYTETDPVPPVGAGPLPGNALLSGTHRRDVLTPLPVASRLACCGASVLE